MNISKKKKTDIKIIQNKITILNNSRYDEKKFKIEKLPNPYNKIIIVNNVPKNKINMNQDLIDTIELRFDKINESLGTDWLVENLGINPAIVEDYKAKDKVLNYLKGINGWDICSNSTEELLDLSGINHKTYNKSGVQSIILNELSKFDKSYNEWFAQVWLTLLDKIPIEFFINKHRTKPLKILDAGSAAGAFLYPIKQALFHEYNIVVEIDGIDISSDCIGFANIAKVGGHNNWKIGNIVDLKKCFIPRFNEKNELKIEQYAIQDNTYDLVISNGVFFCLDHDRQLQAFNECMRITKPSGYLLIGRNNNSDSILSQYPDKKIISWEWTLYRGGSYLKKLNDEEYTTKLVTLPNGERCEQLSSYFSSTYYQYKCPDWNKIISLSEYKNTINLGLTQCSDLWTGNRTFFDDNGKILGFQNPFNIHSNKKPEWLLNNASALEKYPSLKDTENISLKSIIENKKNRIKYFLDDEVYELRHNVTFQKHIDFIHELRQIAGYKKSKKNKSKKNKKVKSKKIKYF